MHINDWLEQFKAVGVNAGGGGKQLRITVAAAPLMILNSTTRRHSMTTITLDTPSSTGFSGDLAHGLLAGIDPAKAADARLRRLHAEGLGALRRRFPEPKAAVPVPLDYDGGLAAVVVLGMSWTVGMGRLNGGVRPFHDKAEPP